MRGDSASRAVFAATCAALILYAIRGGTFDVIPRSEAGIVAWWTVALGWVAGVLPRARTRRVVLLPLAGLALLAAWTALSLAWTESAGLTAGELARIAHHAGLLTLFVSVLSGRTWKAAVGGATAGAALVCAVAVASRLVPGAFPDNHVGEAFGATRLSYPLNYWNAVAAWGAITSTLAVTLSAHVARAATRALLLAAVPVAMTATYLTYSRAGVAGTALGLVMALALARHRAVLLAHAVAAGAGTALVIWAIRMHPAIARGEGDEGAFAVAAALLGAAALGAGVALATRRLQWSPSRRAARFAITGATVAAVAVAAVVLPTAGFGSRSGPVVADPAARLGNLEGTRTFVWASALAAFAQAPVEGTGAGTFGFWWSRDARDPEYVTDAHSLFLEALAELGFPGLAAVLLLCGGGLVVCATARDQADSGAAAACFAGFGVWVLHASVDWMWESTATVALALTLVAAAAASRSQAVGRASVPVRGGVAVTAIVAIAVLVPPLVATSSLRASQAAAAEDELGQAHAAADDAVAAQPWSAAPFVQRALLAELGGQLESAERDVRRAVALEPTNWEHELLLARVLAERGEADEAVAAYERARRLRPLARVFAQP